MLDRLRIVLVEPAGPANVGAVCRAMANMGLSRLVLVAPACDLSHPDAIGFAAHAGPLLESAQIVPDLPAALAGCVITFATTARPGLYRTQAYVAVETAARIAVETATNADVAFVFGPERTGLVNSALLELDRVVQIPADPAYPVLNLAAAVLIVCYELRRAAAGAENQARTADEAPADLPESGGRWRKLADNERKSAMFSRLFDSLEQIGFFFGQNPDHLKYALRNLLGRTGLSEIECDILSGLARQIRWYANANPREFPPQGPDAGDGAPANPRGPAEAD